MEIVSETHISTDSVIDQKIISIAKIAIKMHNDYSPPRSDNNLPYHTTKFAMIS